MKYLGNKSLAAKVAVATNLLWWLELIAGCIGVVMMFMTAHIRKGFALQVPVTYKSTTIGQIYSSERNGSFSILNTSNGILSIHVGANWQVITMLLIGYGLLFAVVAMITYQIKKIFEKFEQNQPFHSTNMYRVRNIASILISYSLAKWVLVIAVNHILMSKFIFKHMELTYDFNFSCFLIGIVLLVMEGVFKSGLALEEEKQLTI